MNTDLNNITNENGGGLSTAVTGKYTSVRHERAMRDADKMTGGQVAVMLRKHGHAVTAHDLVDIFRELIGGYPEWHHSGFHSKGMGRTYFYTREQAAKLLELMPTLAAKREARKAREEQERKAKAAKMVKGFAYRWVKEGSRNVKELITYEGSLLAAPKGFVALEDDRFAVAKEMQGRIYRGYDEPRWSDFCPAEWAAAKEAEAKAKEEAKQAEAQRAAELKAKIELEAKDREAKMEEAKRVFAGIGSDPVEVFRAWRECGYNDPTGAVTALKNALGISWSQVRSLAKS